MRPKRKFNEITAPPALLAEAERHFRNAEEILSGLTVDDYGRYSDTKYSSEACATFYRGLVLSFQAFATKKRLGVDFKFKQDFIRVILDHFPKSERDQSTTDFSTAYINLHVVGYYEGHPDEKAISAGMEAARRLHGLIEELVS